MGRPDYALLNSEEKGVFNIFLGGVGQEVGFVFRMWLTALLSLDLPSLSYFLVYIYLCAHSRPVSLVWQPLRFVFKM